MKKTLILYRADTSGNLLIPIYEGGVKAGFPSPAQDYAASRIDLNVALMIDPGNTRIAKIEDDDLAGVNIYDGDWAIIATDMVAGKNDKVVCGFDGEMVNRIVGFEEASHSIILSSTNPQIASFTVSPDHPCHVYGVITYTITSHIPVQFYPNGLEEGTVNLNKLLVKNEESTFLGFIDGDSMMDAGILDGDLAVIDRSLPYIDGYVALCQVQDNFTAKYLEWDKKEKGILWLKPANKEFPPIKVEKDESVKIWGIITHTITPHTRKFNIL